MEHIPISGRPEGVGLEDVAVCHDSMMQLLQSMAEQLTVIEAKVQMLLEGQDNQQ
jgi:hypothetical protein